MIHSATLVHAAALAAIHGAAFSDGDSWSANVIGLQLGLLGGFGLLDERGGMLLARIVADEAEVLTLAVAPEVRRQGIATALLRAARHRAYQDGARCLFLEVGVANGAAQALYGGLGFVEVGRRRRYYRDGSDALVLRLPLNSDAGKGAGSLY
ncbi:MAG TPA: GNAT family N-acetyltransferase [Acetobacteraceae bacterium]|nr:GNAT family N-acetyltransferase [Acetobacteraceae bacterium]